MTPQRPSPQRFVKAISRSGRTIYDVTEIGDLQFWIPTTELQALLDAGLRGVSLAGLPLRTRSKVVKELVCKALGYPVPTTFRKTQPRFPGQLLDTYVQKSNNLQVWNEELSPSRRYALIRVSAEDAITRVKVVTGAALAKLDTTGTLTQKYQARCIPSEHARELVTAQDTAQLQPHTARNANVSSAVTPVDHPAAGSLLPISTLFERLGQLVGRTFDDAGTDQERNRGAALHRLVCQALGYASYQEDGQFPDVPHQLCEVKLQTSPTIDLGLVRPDSVDALDVPQLAGQPVRHRDVRYAVFYARIDGRKVVLTHLILTTGEAFFTRFPQFGGKVINRKLQIPLPRDFFEV